MFSIQTKQILDDFSVSKLFFFYLSSEDSPNIGFSSGGGGGGGAGEGGAGESTPSQEQQTTVRVLARPAVRKCTQ